MNNFNAGTWFAEKVRYKPIETEINGITFPLIPLNDDQKESIELAESYDEMIEIAVSSAMSSDGVRLINDSQLNEYYDSFWEEYDGDPSVKAQLGEFVCEISELSDVIDEAHAKKLAEDVRAAEAREYLEAENSIVDGDDLGDTSITLGQLESDATTYTTAA